MLFFGKVRIDITKLKEFGEKLQAGALGPSFTKATYCLLEDPTVGLNIWEARDREDLEKKLKPHRVYYTELLEITPMILPQESQKILMERMKRN
jgi:hypothetical protein